MGVVCDLDRKPARLPLFILSCLSLCLGLDTENVTTSQVLYLMDLIKSRLSIVSWVDVYIPVVFCLLGLDNGNTSRNSMLPCAFY